MATPIAMKNPKTGQVTDAYYGFSWTTFFFGAFPAAFRSDFVTFIVSMLVFCFLTLTTGIGGYVAAFIWAFMYNKHHALSLLKQGYVFNGTEEQNRIAAMNLKVELNEFNTVQPVPAPAAPVTPVETETK